MARNKVRNDQITIYNGVSSDNRYFNITINSPTQLSIGSGKLAQYDNTTWSFSGDTLTLPPTANGDGSWYIGIDPNTDVTNTGNPICKKVHAFRHRMHSAMIWLCKINRTNNIVTITETYTPVWPKSSVNRFKSKAISSSGSGGIGAPIRIAVLGTSLSNFISASSKTNLDSDTVVNAEWYSLLFNSNVSTNPNGSSYRIPGLTTSNTRFTIDNFSMGSNNHNYHAMWLADGVQCICQNPNSLGSTWAIRPGKSRRKLDPSNRKPILKSPFLTNPYDLVIFDSLPNGGSHKFLHMDNIIRKLREVGTEVVIVIGSTSHNGTVASDGTESQRSYVKQIADARGCDIADCNDFIIEKIESVYPMDTMCNGGSTGTVAGGKNIACPLADTIHPRNNRHGSGLWAEAIRGCINSLSQEAKQPDAALMKKAVSYELSSSASTSQPWMPTHYEFSSYPISGSSNITYESGNTVIYYPAGGIPAGVKMPETAYGGKTAASSSAADAPVMVIPLSGNLKFGHPFAIGATILVQNDSVAWGLRATDGTNTLTTINEDGSNGTRGMIYEITTFDSTTNWKPAVSNTQLGGPLWNGVLSLNSISGSPKIRGVLWHLPGEVEDILTTDMSFTGSWVDTTADNGNCLLAKATNSSSATDYCEFSCKGRCVMLHIEQGVSSGFIDVWVNDVKVISAQDTFRSDIIGNGFVKILPPLGVSPTPNMPDFGTSIDMNVRVAYTGNQNGSSSAPAGSNYRLKIAGASIIK
jgi:hypothetical protein